MPLSQRNKCWRILSKKDARLRRKIHNNPYRWGILKIFQMKVVSRWNELAFKNLKQYESNLEYIFSLAASLAECCFSTSLQNSKSESISPSSELATSSSLAWLPGSSSTSSEGSTPAPARTLSSCFLLRSPMSSRFGKSSSPEITFQRNKSCYKTSSQVKSHKTY